MSNSSIDLTQVFESYPINEKADLLTKVRIFNDLDEVILDQNFQLNKNERDTPDRKLATAMSM